MLFGGDGQFGEFKATADAGGCFNVYDHLYILLLFKFELIIIYE